MTNDERYLLLKSVFCCLDNEDDEDVQIARSSDKNDCELADFYEIRLQLWCLSPPRRVLIDWHGEVQCVQLMKTVPLDRPEYKSLSKENWDIPAIDQELLRLARRRANDILKTVKMFDGSSARSEQPDEMTTGDIAFSMFADKLAGYIRSGGKQDPKSD